MNKSKKTYSCKLIFAMMIFLSVISLKKDVCSQEAQTGLFSKWYWSQPSPTGNLLKSIHFTNHNSGFAAGDLGAIIKTTDGGDKWNVCQSATSEDLNEISFLNETTGFAAGNSGTILKTTDCGNNWFNISYHSKVSFYDIQFCDKLTGYASGLNGIIIKSTDTGNSWFTLYTGESSALFCISFLNDSVGAAGGYNVLLKTTNGGLNWTKQNLNQNFTGAIKGVTYIDENTICAAGDLPGGVFIKTTDGGNNWNLTYLGLPYLFGGSVDLIRGMSFINSNTGFIVTDFATILKTTDSGISWKRDSSFRPSYAKLSVMYDVNISSQEKISICGGGGSVFISDNAGEDWIVKSGYKNSLRECKFADSKTGIAAGEKGEFLKTTDGGLTWMSCNHFTGKFLNTVFSINEKIYYAAGDSGIIFRTSDGGIHWSDLTNYKKYDIQSIYFIDENTGVAAGGYQDGERAFIYKTTNAGVNWFEAYDSLGLGELNSLIFINNTLGFCAGNNGNILRTFDGGYSWESENIFPENLYSVNFNDPKNGLISCENGLILKTTNGGDNWDYIISGSYVNLYSIKYLSEDIAIAAGEKGTLLYSYNGGISWQKEFSITKNDIHSVEYNFNDKIFAAGDYGTLINSGIYDPKVYASTYKEYRNTESLMIQNYPNPFNPATVIRYKLKGINDFINIKVYSADGKEVAVLINERMSPGLHSVRFDIHETGTDLPSGIYFYRLSINDRISGVGRMAFIK